MFQMLFRRRPVPSLQQAQWHILQACAIAYAYKRATNHIPTPDEILALHVLVTLQWENYQTLNYIYHSVLKRISEQA